MPKGAAHLTGAKMQKISSAGSHWRGSSILRRVPCPAAPPSSQRLAWGLFAAGFGGGVRLALAGSQRVVQFGAHRRQQPHRRMGQIVQVGIGGHQKVGLTTTRRHRLFWQRHRFFSRLSEQLDLRVAFCLSVRPAHARSQGCEPRHTLIMVR